MMQKARHRKQEEDKDTEFTYGGRVWDSKRVESTVSRAKRARLAESNDDAGKCRRLARALKYLG